MRSHRQPREDVPTTGNGFLNEYEAARSIQRLSWRQTLGRLALLGLLAVGGVAALEKAEDLIPKDSVPSETPRDPQP